jgi:hypothetical protein
MRFEGGGEVIMEHRLWMAAVLACTTGLCAQAQAPASEPAELILINAKVWTGEKEQPRAQAVAVRDGRIVAVGSVAQVNRFSRIGRTKVLDLAGKLVVPGFIDNHTHFASAGRLLLGLNLLDVNEPEEFRRRVAEGAARLPAGAWLAGGDWGAYAQWGMSSAGASQKPDTAGTEAKRAQRSEFLPTKDLIDSVTGDHPALINRFDGQLYLANSRALRAAGITAETPNPAGGEIVRGADGQPNGLLRGTAVDLVRKAITPASYEQRKAEALRALQELAQFGVTTIHDNTANFDQFELYRDLQRSGELTTRIWARMPLVDWEKVRDYTRDKNVPAVAGGWGDDMIRLGGLKAWVDGIMGNSSALFWEPYSNNPQSYGRLRPVMFPEGNLHRLMAAADKAGFTVTVHAIGDYANHLLLDTCERVFAANGARDRRFRVVHAQVLDAADVPRLAKLGLVAEVQPYHAIDDMRWMEERIGARAKGAYLFKSLQQSGAVISFGSDWPGTNASYYTTNPLWGMYAAATRQTLKGEPAAGWFPEERIALADAMRFYTVNNAWTTFEEETKGSIKVGKLADLVVLDRDIFERPARELLETEVLYTILGGRIVYQKQ